jgi:uncharacterized protein YhbP (UPF0306 family)
MDGHKQALTREAELIGRLRGYLAARSTMVLATVGPGGQAQSAPCFFVADRNLTLYFVSGVDSRHSRNLIERPRVATSIYVETHDWRDIQGVQLEGLAAQVEDQRELTRVWSLYRGKFPFAADFVVEVEGSNWYRVQPTWIRWIDNRVRFGHKEEIWLDQIR